MKVKAYALALIAGASLLLAAGCGDQAAVSQAKQETITVSAAASLKGAMTEIVKNYEAEKKLSANAIAVTFAGSGTLREQIENGAPSSIFISANVKHMKTLEDKNLVTDVKPLVTNSLVIVVPKGKEAYTTENLINAKRVAIGTPATVPAGSYAKQSLEYLNLWPQVEPKIVYGKDVKAVLAYVVNGSVDAGFVYKTDAISAKDKVTITETLPPKSHKAIVYPIAMIKAHDTAASKDFYNYLNSPAAKAVFEKYGFAAAQEAGHE